LHCKSKINSINGIHWIPSLFSGFLHLSVEHLLFKKYACLKKSGLRLPFKSNKEKVFNYKKNKIEKLSFGRGFPQAYPKEINLVAIKGKIISWAESPSPNRKIFHPAGKRLPD
jgi:hypothetical protein